jgi:hypothetical protein
MQGVPPRREGRYCASTEKLSEQGSKGTDRDTAQII